MKKLIYYCTGFFLILVSLTGVVYFMFAGNIPAKVKFITLKKIKGGIVYNNTSSEIKISSDSYIGFLPAKKSSIDRGIIDVDALIIDRPMDLWGKTLENKVLKFCDLGVIELSESKDGRILIKEKKFSWVCSLANDFKVYDSLKEAFGQ